MCHQTKNTAGVNKYEVRLSGEFSGSNFFDHAIKSLARINRVQQQAFQRRYLTNSREYLVTGAPVTRPDKSIVNLDMNFSTFIEVSSKYRSKKLLPASTLVEVPSLVPKESMVEYEVVVALPG